MKKNKKFILPEYFQKHLINIVFYLLIAIFIIIAGIIMVPDAAFIKRRFFPLMAFFSIAFFLLGLVLIFLAKKKKINKKLKKFLILTGVSASGFFVCSILHNFFYALAVVASNITVLRYLMEILHVIFFITAILICPFGFLIGAIFSAALFCKKQKRK